MIGGLLAALVVLLFLWNGRSTLIAALAIPTSIIATFALIALALPLSVLLESLTGVLEAAQRFDLVTAFRIPFLLCEALVPLYGLHIGWDLPTIAALQLAITVVFLIIYFLLCAWVLPDLRRRPRFDREELKRLFGFGKWVIVSNVVGPLFKYLDRLAIGMVTPSTSTHNSCPLTRQTATGTRSSISMRTRLGNDV